MALHTQTLTVQVPPAVAYQHWIRFESFPRFMELVREVRPLGPERFSWRMEVAGFSKTWEMILTEHTPNRSLAWRGVGSTPISGHVLLEPLGTSATRVTLALNYTPENAMERMGERMGIIGAALQKDLHNFKRMVEHSPARHESAAPELAREVGG